MWSKRTPDEPAQTPQRTSPSISPNEPPRRELNSTMASSTRSFDSEGAVRNGSAALGKNVTVKGQIFAREDLTIDGEVEGTVECHDHRLTIGPNARVLATLKAREIIIHGSIQGNIEATDKIDMKKEAKLVGDIKTTRIVIEDGAYFKGSIDISKTAAKPSSQVPVQTPIQSTGQSSAATANSAGVAPLK